MVRFEAGVRWISITTGFMGPPRLKGSADFLKGSVISEPWRRRPQNRKILGAQNGRRRTVLVRFGPASVDFNYNYLWGPPRLEVPLISLRVH